MRSFTLSAPVKLDDGRVVDFPAPQFVAFFLVEAQRHLKRGERLRRQTLNQLRRHMDGSWSTTNPAVAFDCFSELAAAVLFAYAATESLANGIIEGFPDEMRWEHAARDGTTKSFDKSEIVRRLSTSTKLGEVIPQLTEAASIKGTRTWEGFVALRRIRDELVHIKHGGYSATADEPSEYGMLLQGRASTCVADAVALVDALNPAWLSAATRRALDVK